MIRIRVVLPHPDGPTSERNSPGAMVSETPFKTSVAPKDLRMEKSSTLAMMCSRFHEDGRISRGDDSAMTRP